MRIAALQINPLVGSPEKNYDKLESLIMQHAKEVDLFVSPELALIGYPPRDLLAYPSLLEREENCLKKISALSEKLGVGILIGHTQKNSLTRGKPLYNSASLFDGGARIGTIHKTRLPSYNIFSEERFFEAAPEANLPLNFRGTQLGISICEDSWDHVIAFGRQDVRSYTAESNPVHGHKAASIEINLSASPYSVGKISSREDLIRAMAMRHKKTLIYCNCVGAQDDIVFDGGSLVYNSQGELCALGKRFSEDVVIVDTNGLKALPEAAPNSVYNEMTDALVLGLRDYAQKNRFKSAIIGISGGIDSALCAYLACLAFGPKNVYGVALPSALTSQESLDLSVTLAKSLGFNLRTISIADSVEQSVKLTQIKTSGLPYENLQSRTRGMMLMALSNSEGHLLLSTGNKSELAMGYGTLYGDMCGGLNPLGDLYKTEVYALVHQAVIAAAVAGAPAPIPAGIYLRPPTAELAPGQKDSDSLPAYEMLDHTLEDLIENGGRMRYRHYEKLLAPNFNLESLTKKIHSQEFKRFQSPPIVRVHLRAFGSAWQMPLSKESP